MRETRRSEDGGTTGADPLVDGSAAAAYPSPWARRPRRDAKSAAPASVRRPRHARAGASTRPSPAATTVPRGDRIAPTDGALAAFAARTGIVTRRADLAWLLRDLVAQEGRLLDARPAWAPEVDAASGWIALGDWLLLVLAADPKHPGRTSVTDVLAVPGAPDWAEAVRRGHILTPPPPHLAAIPVGRRSAHEVVAAAHARRQMIGGGFASSIMGELVDQRERRRGAYVEYQAARWTALRRDWA